MVLHRLRRVCATPAVLALSGLFAVIVLHGACDKVPLLAPTGTVITLHATTNAVPVDGSTDIIAVLIRSGQQTTTSGNGSGTSATTTPPMGTPVHHGTVVSFTTTLGSIDPSEVKTDDSGQVKVTLTGDGRSGVATVTAYSGAATQTLAVTIGATAAARIMFDDGTHHDLGPLAETQAAAHVVSLTNPRNACRRAPSRLPHS